MAGPHSSENYPWKYRAIISSVRSDVSSRMVVMGSNAYPHIPSSFDSGPTARAVAVDRMKVTKLTTIVSDAFGSDF